MGIKTLVIALVCSGVVLMSLITPLASMLSSVETDNSSVIELERLNRISNMSSVTESLRNQIEAGATEEANWMDDITLVIKSVYASIRSFFTTLPNYIGFIFDIDYYLGLPTYLVEALVVIITIYVAVMIVAYLTGRTQKDDN